MGGLVLSAGIGQAPARQAALKAGLGEAVPCTTINKVCSSGLKAVQIGAISIQSGLRDIVVVGGMESMSNAPYIAPAMRRGARMGDSALQDTIMRDGLTDSCGTTLLGQAMGMSAELCCQDHDISRADLDAHATASYQRSMAATAAGKFKAEIVPVKVKRGTVTEDEEVSRSGASDGVLDKLSKMKPAFKRNGGIVTAGNSSTISDGGAAFVLCTRKKAKELNLKIHAVVRGMADAAQVSEKFTTSPAIAIPKALDRAGVRIQDVDFFEINEAFSAVSVANNKLLGLNPEKVNVYGGSVSIGHPIGASGARILCTMISVLSQEGGRLGVVGICNGGGGASALVIESGAPRARL